MCPSAFIGPSGIRERLGLFNVLDPTYGAIGDGVANDSLAIQAAMDAASAAATAAGGKTRACVVIPGPYTYKLTYSQDMADVSHVAMPRFSCGLLMRSNIDLVGVGRPRLYANQVGQNTPVDWIAKAIIGELESNFHDVGGSGDRITDMPSLTNFSIRGLCLDGGFVSNQQSAGIAFPDGSEGMFGIHLPGAMNYEITHNYITGIWGDSITTGQYLVHDALIADNYITLFGGQAINVQYGSRITVSRNICHDSQAFSGGSSETIAMDFCTDSIASDNIVTKAGTLGYLGSSGVLSNNFVAPIGGGSGAIEAYSPSGGNIVISGNTVDLALYGADQGSANRGIFVAGTGSETTPYTITGNIVKLSDSTRYAGSGGITGIQVASTAVVTGNEVWAAIPANDVNGFDIYCLGARSVISGNVCLSNTGGSIICIGAGSVISGNLGIGQVYLEAANIQVVGNSFASAATGQPAVRCFNSGCVIEANRLDGTALGAVIDYPAGSGGSNVFRNNTMIGQVGVNLQSAAIAGYSFGDIFDNNLVTVGVLNLQAGQFYKRSSGALNTLAYSATIATNANLGDLFTITATNGTAFTISNPTNPVAGMRIAYSILNSSGGSLGVVTWGAAFKLDATGFVNPANGKSKTIQFFYDGTNWRQVGPATADI